MDINKKKDLIILGAGGYAHQVYWVVQRIGEFSVLGFLDETIPKGDKRFYRETVISSDFKALSESRSAVHLICAIGDLTVRKRWVKEYGNAFNFVSIIDPSVMIAPDAWIGKNVVILGGTICSTESIIEDSVNINWQCLVAHDVVVGQFTNLSSGVKLAGGVTIGHSCDLGTGATVIPRRKVGNNVILGAGAVVINDIPSDTTAVGMPGTSG